MTMLDTPDQIEAFRLLSIRGRLKLEMRGIRFRISTFGYVRREFGFKGTRQSVYNQYEAMLKERGIIQ